MSQSKEYRTLKTYGKVSNRRWETATILSSSALVSPQAPNPARDKDQSSLDREVSRKLTLIKGAVSSLSANQVAREIAVA